MQNNKEAKKLLNEVGADKLWEIALTESVKSEGYTSIEDYAQQRLTNELVLTEVDVLKIGIDWKNIDLVFVQNELDETKQQLAALNAAPVPIVDVTMFNSMMNQFNTINEKLTPVSNFFNDTPEAPVKKRISKKEQERLDFEAYEKRLQAKALAYIKNGGK